MRKLSIILALLLISSLLWAKKEHIRFNLKFGMIKGGEAEIIISDTIFNGTPAIYYYMLTRTTGVTNKLFGVYDVYETIVDAETRLPLKAIRNIKEKNYRWYNETMFYHEKDSLNSQRTGWQEMPKNVVDMLSVFFYFINKHLTPTTKPGYMETFKTFHGDKIEDTTIKYSGKELLKTKMGETSTLVLSPVVNKGKLLNRSDGLKFFISEKTKIPLMIEFDMKLGNLWAKLKSYKIDGVEQVKK